MTHKTVHDGQAGVCWGRSVVAHYLMVVPAYSPAGYQPPLHAANTGNYLKLEIIGIKIIELSFSCSLFWTKEVCTEENPISLTGWLFNLAYGLKWNYLLKMKFYLFINWLWNTKRIKTFLIHYDISVNQTKIWFFWVIRGDLECVGIGVRPT